MAARVRVLRQAKGKQNRQRVTNESRYVIKVMNGEQERGHGSLLVFTEPKDAPNLPIHDAPS